MAHRAPVDMKRRHRIVQAMQVPAERPLPEDRSYPWLTLSGRWLERAGFRSGRPVTIAVKRQCLIIKPAPPAGDSRHAPPAHPDRQCRQR